MSDTARPRRSALYMPASNPRALAKARSLPADVIILDLEDAVAPEAKEDARAAAIAAAAEGGFGLGVRWKGCRRGGREIKAGCCTRATCDLALAS